MFIGQYALKSLMISLGISKQYQLYGSGGSRPDIVEVLKLKKIEENSCELDKYSNSWQTGEKSSKDWQTAAGGKECINKSEKSYNLNLLSW